MTTKEKIQAIKDTAEAIGGEIRTDYSGRGMFGKTCYGIDCGDATACIEEAATRGLRNAKTDQMGKDYIVYWEQVRDVSEKT